MVMRNGIQTYTTNMDGWYTNIKIESDDLQKTSNREGLYTNIDNKHGGMVYKHRQKTWRDGIQT